MNIDIGGSKHVRTLGGKWKICDISKGSDYPCNLNEEPLPFKNNSVSNIFCSHTMEHIEPRRIPVVFAEMLRVLKPNGKIRIVVPDAEKAANWYVKDPRKLRAPGLPTKPKFVPETKMGFLNAWFYTHGKGHRSGYDWELLRVYMLNAGFKDIERKKFDDCSKVFKDKDYARYKNNSIFCEAKK